eukprot:669370-Rhodomonas_salina.1
MLILLPLVRSRGLGRTCKWYWLGPAYHDPKVELCQAAVGVQERPVSVRKPVGNVPSLYTKVQSSSRRYRVASVQQLYYCYLTLRARTSTRNPDCYPGYRLGRLPSKFGSHLIGDLQWHVHCDTCPCRARTGFQVELSIT